MKLFLYTLLGVILFGKAAGAEQIVFKCNQESITISYFLSDFDLIKIPDSINLWDLAPCKDGVCYPKTITKDCSQKNNGNKFKIEIIGNIYNGNFNGHCGAARFPSVRIWENGKKFFETDLELSHENDCGYVTKVIDYINIPMYGGMVITSTKNVALRSQMVDWIDGKAVLGKPEELP